MIVAVKTIHSAPPLLHAGMHLAPSVSSRTILTVRDTKFSYRPVTVQAATAHPTAILIREKALIINLEAVRMIVCKDQLFIISIPGSDPTVHSSVPPAPEASFVQDLVAKISQRAADAE